MARAFRRSCRHAGVQLVPSASLLTIAMAIPFGWTYVFAKAFGMVPVPWTRAYSLQLAASLLQTWLDGTQACNTAIEACSLRSWVRAPTAAAARSKVRQMVALVRGAAGAAPRGMVVLNSGGGFGDLLPAIECPPVSSLGVHAKVLQ